MLGWLLASTITITCVVTNFDPQPTLTCSDKQTRTVSYFDWPQEWHGPEMGFTYTLVDGKPQVSLRDELKGAAEVERARSHQRRWHQNRNIREGVEP